MNIPDLIIVFDDLIVEVGDDLVMELGSVIRLLGGGEQDIVGLVNKFSSLHISINWDGWQDMEILKSGI